MTQPAITTPAFGNFSPLSADMRRNLRDSAPDVPEREGDAEAAREALEPSKSEDARLLLAVLCNDEGKSGVRTLPKNFLTKAFFLQAKPV